MSLSNFTGTVTAAALRSNFDDKTTTLASNSIAGRKDQTIFLRMTSLANSTVLSARSIAWTPRDDMEVRVFCFRNTDTTASRALTATITQADDDAEQLVDNTVSLSITTINGTSDTRTDYRTTTGTRFRLKGGVRYRLTLANNTAATTTGVTMAMLQLRTIRRAS